MTVISTGFIGVDGEAFGDGGSDTQPIDAALQIRLMWNNRELADNLHYHAWCPVAGQATDFQSFAGIRPYAASAAHSVWLGWTFVTTDQSGLKVTLVYHSDTPGGAGTMAGTNEVKIKLPATGDETDWTELNTTYSAGVETGHQSITLTFNDPVSASPDGGYWTPVLIAVRSNTDTYTQTGIGSTSDGSSTNFTIDRPYLVNETQDGGGNEFWQPNSTGTHPDADSVEILWWLPSTTGGTTYLPNGGFGGFDLVCTEDAGVEGTVAYTVQDLAIPLNTTNGTAYKHQCFMLRAALFEPVIGLPSTYALPRQQLKGNIEFGSAEALQMAYTAEQMYLRPRVLASGPAGKKIDAAATEQALDAFTGAYDYATHWPHVMGDYDGGTTTGQELDLINDPFFLDTENPTLELRTQWICVHHGTHNNLEELRDTKPTSKDWNAGGTDTLGLSKWDLAIDVEQMEDAAAATADWDTDPTSYGTDSATIDMPVYPAAVLGELPPVLRGIDSMEQHGKGTGSYPGFWFREGSMFLNQDADVEPVRINRLISLSGMTGGEWEKPFRLKLTMTYDSYPDPMWPDTEATMKADLRLMLVSWTLVEKPQRP